MTSVVIALSGGVDSSVAAALLKRQGYEVIGMMMRLWSEPGSEAANRCCTLDALAMARRVASRLEIPFYAVDARQIFKNVVVSHFLDGYTRGVTPNPCVVCNRYIRWDFLLKRTISIGANYLATGHYARIKEDKGKIKLLRGVDPQKDQSYVLSVLNQEQLRYAIFPVGGYTKPQVRQLARDFGLPVAERTESQDLCFLGDEDYRYFLRRYSPEVVKPGMIVTRDGQQLGEHHGLAFYTIGQRKGLGISSSVPMYVLAKEASTNSLIVGKLEELGGLELTAKDVNWVSGISPTSPVRAQVKIRYKATDAWGLVTPLDAARVHIVFDIPLRDITPGQQAVFYDGENCLGSGVVEI
jgi:tRNA-specific 2-thiouridylase